jgi:hypothetical protein
MNAYEREHDERLSFHERMRMGSALMQGELYVYSPDSVEEPGWSKTANEILDAIVAVEMSLGPGGRAAAGVTTGPRRLAAIAAGVARLRVVPGLRDLQKYRATIGLPRALSAADRSTTARLDLGGVSLYGHNAHGRQITLKVNNQTKHHAEADVFQQAYEKGIRGRKGTLYVDRALCKACGQFGGARSMVRQLGLEELTVVTPWGRSTITP